MRITRMLMLFLVMLSAPLAAEESAALGGLKTLDGRDAQLADHVGQGKWLLVMLWASDCVICNREVPALSDFHFEHSDDLAEVIGVSLDGYDKRAEAQAFLDRHDPIYPNYVGEFMPVALGYQVMTGERLLGTPTFLLFTPKGELVANNPGPVSGDAVLRFIDRYQPS